MKNVIIIGSGIGGLTAGNLLAKNGHKVTIFEAHSMTGGYTAQVIRPIKKNWIWLFHIWIKYSV